MVLSLVISFDDLDINQVFMYRTKQILFHACGDQVASLLLVVGGSSKEMKVF